MLTVWNSYRRVVRPTVEQPEVVQRYNRPVAAQQSHYQKPWPVQSSVYSSHRETPNLQPPENFLFTGNQDPATYIIQRPGNVPQQVITPQSGAAAHLFPSSERKVLGGAPPNHPTTSSRAQRLPVSTASYSNYLNDSTLVPTTAYQRNIQQPRPATHSTVSHNHHPQSSTSISNFALDPRLFENNPIHVPPRGRQEIRALSPTQAEIPFQFPHNSQNLTATPQASLDPGLCQSQRNLSSSTGLETSRVQVSYSEYQRGSRVGNPTHNALFQDSHSGSRSGKVSNHNNTQQVFTPLEYCPEKYMKTRKTRVLPSTSKHTRTVNTSLSTHSLPNSSSSTTPSTIQKPIAGVDTADLHQQPSRTAADMNPSMGNRTKRPAEDLLEDACAKSDSKRRNIEVEKQAAIQADSVGLASLSGGLAANVGSNVTGASIPAGTTSDDDELTKILGAFEGSTSHQEATGRSDGDAELPKLAEESVVIYAKDLEAPTSNQAGSNLKGLVGGGSVSMPTTVGDGCAQENQTFEPMNVVASEQPHGIAMPDIINNTGSTALLGASTSHASAAQNPKVLESLANLQNLPIDFNSTVDNLSGPRMSPNAGSSGPVVTSSQQSPNPTTAQTVPFQEASWSHTTGAPSPYHSGEASYNDGSNDGVPSSPSLGIGSPSSGPAFSNTSSPQPANCATVPDANTFVDPCKICHGWDLYDPANICEECYHIVRPKFARNKFRNPNAQYILDKREERLTSKICAAIGKLYCIDDKKGEGCCMNCGQKIIDPPEWVFE